MTKVITFALSNFSLTFLFLGLIISGVSLLIKRQKKPNEIADYFLAGYLFSAIGLSFLYNFIMHVFFAEMAAKFIGWQNSPFQYEVGYASLGFAVVAICACRSSFHFRLAAILGPAFFLWGAAGGHIYQIITADNYASGNAGVVLWTDIFLPILGFILLKNSYPCSKDEGEKKQMKRLYNAGIMFLIFLSFGLLIFIGGCNMGVEEAKYRVISKERNFELRKYEPQIVAETVIDGTLEDAGNKAFRPLFQYISGANRSKDKIAMTAPVSQEEKSEEIAMTAPVSQQAKEDKWVVSFTMPASYTMETIPEPTNPRVKLREIPACTMAAICYSGKWSEENYKKNLEKLKVWISDKNLKPLRKPVWARYNPPFTIWFLRRNEILIQVENEEEN